MDCEDLLKELNDYLEEEMTPEERRHLEEHLADCRPCKVVADTCRKTVQIVTECGSFDLPPKISARIMSKIKAAAPGGKPPSKGRA